MPELKRRLCDLPGLARVVPDIHHAVAAGVQLWAHMGLPKYAKDGLLGLARVQPKLPYVVYNDILLWPHSGLPQ